MEFGKYLRTVIPGWRSRKPLATPPAMGYIRRTETVGCQSGSDHSHPMVSVMSLLLNLLFLFCMHLFRLRYLTVCLIYMLFGIVALNLIRYGQFATKSSPPTTRRQHSATNDSSPPVICHPGQFAAVRHYLWQVLIISIN